MDNNIRIHSQSTKWLTKQELIEIIENNFDDEHGSICVITTTKAYSDTSDINTMQSIVFGKVLNT